MSPLGRIAARLREHSAEQSPWNMSPTAEQPRTQATQPGPPPQASFPAVQHCRTCRCEPKTRPRQGFGQ